MSPSVLNQLFQSGQVAASSRNYQQRELDRLQRMPRRTYLQDYDLLFRYVSRWLGEQGYELTNKQPHQVLARVCEQFMPREQIQEIIRCRHALKYDEILPSVLAIELLQCLLQHLSADGR